MLLGLLEIAFGKQRIAEAKIGVQVIRVESDDVPKLADVFIIFAG